MDFFLKVKELSLKGKTPDEIAFILGTDVGRVRIVLAGQADPQPDREEYELVDEADDEETDGEQEIDEDEEFEKENGV
jgi:hypothetical protein